MKKRLAASIIITTMALSTLTGCGTAKANKPEVPETISETGSEFNIEQEFTETVVEEYIPLEVYAYEITNSTMFGGTVLYLKMPNGHIHVFEEEWVPAHHLTEVWAYTNGSSNYTAWEIVAPSEIIE